MDENEISLDDDPVPSTATTTADAVDATTTTGNKEDDVGNGGRPTSNPTSNPNPDADSDADADADEDSGSGSGSDSDGNANEVRRRGRGDGESAAASAAAVDPRQRRLAELRARMHQSRRVHQGALRVAERERLGPVAEEQSQVWGAIAHTKRNRGVRRLIRSGQVDALPAEFMNLPADEAEAWEKATRVKAGPTAQSIHMEENKYKAYKKRAVNATVPSAVYNEMKRVMKADEFFPSANSVSTVMIAQQATAMAGASGGRAQIGVDRLVDDLKKQAEQREKFSRRRVVNEDADVDFVNERNRIFNKKIARSYGEYTSEIKQNLERGTAI